MTMKRFVLAPLLLLAAAPAAAQPLPGDPIGDPDEPPPPPEEPVEPEPRVVEPPPPAPEPAPVPPTAEAPVADATGRPDGFSIGIGLGWDLPADLQAPNTTSVRFRLVSGLTFEPVVVIAREGSSVDSDLGDSDSSELGVAFAGNVRIPRQLHGKVDLIFLGGAGVGFSSSDPDGTDNNSTSFLLEAHWGLGLEYWIRSQWCLSLTASNPLVSFERDSQETGPGMETTTSSNTIGLVFAPNVVAMVHLFL